MSEHAPDCVCHKCDPDPYPGWGDWRGPRKSMPHSGRQTEQIEGIVPSSWFLDEAGRRQKAEAEREALRAALAASKLDADKTYAWRERFEKRAIRAEADCEHLRAALAQIRRESTYRGRLRTIAREAMEASANARARAALGEADDE